MKSQKKRNIFLTIGAILVPLVIQIIVGIVGVLLESWKDGEIHPAGLLIAEALSLIMVFIFVKNYEDVRTEENKRFGFGIVIVGIIGLFSAQGFMGSVSDVLSKAFSFESSNALSQLSFMDQSKLSHILIMLVTVSMAAPILEEIAFRKMLYNELRTRLGVPMSMIISSLLFGIVHFDISVSIGAFGLGLWLAYIYERFHNITLNIILHGAMNGIVMVLMFIFKDELLDASTQHEEILYDFIRFSIILILSIIVVERIAKKKNDDRFIEENDTITY